MLPISSFGQQLDTAQTPSQYFRRVFHLGQMDVDYTFAQMFYLLVSPRRVYRFVSYRKQTKDQWSRDDPSFVLFLTLFTAVAGCAYGLAFSLSFARLLITTLAVPAVFLALGAFIASVGFIVASRFLRVSSFRSDEQPIEWAYCFDIHCNATFPYFLLCVVGQYIFLPLLLKSTLVATLLSNSMYAAAVLYYSYLTVLGYSNLPFLSNTEVFWYPALIAVVLIMFMTALNLNLTRLLLYPLIGIISKSR